MKYGGPKSGGIEKPLFSAHTHRFWNLSQQTGTWVRRFKVPGFVLGLPTGWRGRSCSAPLSPLFFPVHGDVSTDALEWGCDLNQAHTRKDMPIYENVFWESIRLASSLMSGSSSSKIKTASCCACFFFFRCAGTKFRIKSNFQDMLSAVLMTFVLCDSPLSTMCLVFPNMWSLAVLYVTGYNQLKIIFKASYSMEN